MERFHVKVTFVFIVTILLPSILLCFFALQTVSYEQKQQQSARRQRSERTVEIAAEEISRDFFENTRAALARAIGAVRAESTTLEDFVANLRRVARDKALLSALVVFDARGQRTYPVTRANELARSLMIEAPGGASAPAPQPSEGSTQRSASELLERARLALRAPPFDDALEGLEELRRQAPTPVSLSAALILARHANTQRAPAVAIELLSPYRDCSVTQLGQSGSAVGAELRLELALSYVRAGQRPVGDEVLNELLESLASEASLLSPEQLESVARDASIALELSDTLLEPLLAARRAVQADMEDLELVFGRDIQTLLQERGPDPATPSLLSSAPRSVTRGGDYLKHRVGTSYQVLLYAHIHDAKDRLLGLCALRVGLAEFIARSVAPRVTTFNQRDAELRIVATNPNFDEASARPLGDEEREPIRSRLPEPLDHIEYRAFQKRTTEKIELDRNQARLHVWLITVAMIGIVLGVIATTLTVRREARAAELKTDFVANVTHELKTPLTSIGLFVETLELDHVESDEERKECLAILARETERLSRLIDRLLAFSKLDRKAWKFRLTYEDPVELIEEAAELYRNQRGTPGDGFEVKIESLQASKVTVDREAMIEVVYNLITNAMKYTLPGQREIRVAIAERRREISISVIDNGVGVTRRDRKRIFRKFERGSYAERAQIQGSGIGLTLARSICRGHGGDLNHAPNKPNGSRFIITLPK
jgi:signal transduction histidine kinase